MLESRESTAPESVLSEPDLEEWAAKLGRTAVDARLFVALYGPLGAGKSTLVRAACRELGIDGPVPSPTFTLVNRYTTPSGEPISHVDLYRIEKKSELLDIGWEEMLREPHVVFVEWAERAAGHLPARRWDVVLGMGAGPDTRTVRLIPVGSAPDPPPAPC